MRALDPDRSGSAEFSTTVQRLVWLANAGVATGHQAPDPAAIYARDSRDLTAVSVCQTRYLGAAVSRAAVPHGAALDDSVIQRHTRGWDALREELLRNCREAFRSAGAIVVSGRATPLPASEFEAAPVTTSGGRLIPQTGSVPRHLDRLIAKPWGNELRVYNDGDAFVDAWLLQRAARKGASSHLHPRNHTCLQCTSGYGEIAANVDCAVPIGVSSVLHIEQRAPHRTHAASTMTLAEIETPLHEALHAFGFARRCYEAMARTRARDAYTHAYIRSVATDDAPAAGELLERRERAWLDGLSIALEDQRDAAQPREVRAGPTPETSGSDPASEHHRCERGHQPRRSR